MGNLLMLLLLILVLTGSCCCEGGIKINKKTANAFVRRQKRAYPYRERYYEMFKSPTELKHEQCENYAPCDYYSEIIGFQAAYNLVFGRT
uniref:matrix Gla protein-like n=1 Tax=Euleptes europaea TaxID=460621 RepID=UPI00254069AD|nr:matrix Gla protein-like [Euleptes europaea]